VTAAVAAAANFRAQIIAACLAASVGLSVAQSTEPDILRKAYPLCFELYPDESTVENKACIEVVARGGRGLEREELAAQVRELVDEKGRETREAASREQEAAKRAPGQVPTSVRELFRRAYPLCFELYPDESTAEHIACIEVSARMGQTEFQREQLAAQVREFLNEKDKATRREQEATRRAREEARREQEATRKRNEARAEALSKERLGFFVDRWWLGGTGVVLLARITLQNNSTVRMADFRVECRTYGNSGTALSATSSVLYEALAPKERRTFEVNLGLVHPQSARAACTAAPSSPPRVSQSPNPPAAVSSFAETPAA